MTDEVMNREKILPAAKKFAVLVIAEMRLNSKKYVLAPQLMESVKKNFQI